MSNNEQFGVEVSADVLARRMPGINTAAESATDLAFFNREVMPDLSALILSIKTLIDRGLVSKSFARTLMKSIGFTVASAERHWQGRGRRAGEAVLSVEGLTEVLTKLGKIGDQLPRNSTASDFTWNCDSGFTYTGEHGEKYNQMVVVQTQLAQLAACADLAPLQDGDLCLSHRDAASRINAAADSVAGLHPLFRGYNQIGYSGHPNMRPGFFLRWRQYLAAWPVAGLSYPGPNPAHLAGYPALDLAVGYVESGFSAIVARRRKTMVPEEAAVVDIALSRPSLPSKILEVLQIAADEISGTSIETIGRLAIERRIGPSLLAWARLFAVSRQLSAIHFSLIRNFIDRPSASLSVKERQFQVITEDTGVSLTPVDEVKQLLDMRRNHSTALHLEKAAVAVAYFDTSLKYEYSNGKNRETVC